MLTAALPAHGETPAAAPSAGADATVARAHYQRGTALYDLGKYDEAAKEFEAAYEAKSDPALLYNLAQANRLAGHAEQALHFYRTYLKRVPKPANKVEIEGRIAQLEKQIEEQKAGATPPAGPVMTMTTTPPVAPAPGATASPTPTPSGTLPPATAGAGSWTATQPQPVAGATPMGSAPVGMGPSSSSPSGMVVAQPEAGLGISATAPAQPVGRTQRLVGIGLMAGGGAFAIGGIVFGAMAVSKSHELENLANTRGVYDPNVQAQGKTYQTLQWVFYGVGAASLITGVIVFARAPSAPEAAPMPAKNPGLLVTLQPTAGPSGAGAVLQGVF